MSETKRGYIAVNGTDKARFDKLADGRTQPAFMKRLLDRWEQKPPTAETAIEFIKHLSPMERQKVFWWFLPEFERLSEATTAVERAARMEKTDD